MILEIAKSSEAEIINLIVVERELPLNVASSVLKYTKKGNFLQILYAYPFYILQELLKIFENNKSIKRFAKDISTKYIDPPNTTDFGIMFLPIEGLFAEVVRQPDLVTLLQREYKIVITGPTTLAAMLNSLQMGFKTLAIQKRSSEVWNVLGEVKKEFGNFGGIMQKAQKNIQTGLSQLDDVMGVRTRAIERKLKDVSRLDDLPSSPQTNTSLEENLLDFDQKTD